MARRVQPQKRGQGGKFVKGGGSGASSAEPPVDDVPTITYDDPPKPARASTAKSTARAAKKPAARARPRTAPKPSDDPPPTPRREGTTGDRPLGFLDGLLGPFGGGRTRA